MTSKIKALNISLVFALVFSLMLSMVSFEVDCQNLRDNVFRLHIIAASDSEEDQKLKLIVRDALLRESENLFLGDNDLESAKASAEENIEIITEIANNALRENGCDDTVSVSVGKSYFDTRIYDEYTLPAGTYDALKIEIGEAEGQNWWCVLFPSICVGACSNLNESASDSAANIAENGEKYVVKFKIVEIYEEIKIKISSWL